MKSELTIGQNPIPSSSQQYENMCDYRAINLTCLSTRGCYSTFDYDFTYKQRQMYSSNCVSNVGSIESQIKQQMTTPSKQIQVFIVIHHAKKKYSNIEAHHSKKRIFKQTKLNFVEEENLSKATFSIATPKKLRASLYLLWARGIL